MTRVVIAVEGRDEGLPFIVEPGAMKWEEGAELPIHWNFDYEAPALGQATDVRREENGDITCEIPDEVFNRGLSEFDNNVHIPMDYAAFSKSVEYAETAEDEQRRVVACELVSVGQIPLPVYAMEDATYEEAQVMIALEDELEKVGEVTVEFKPHYMRVDSHGSKGAGVYCTCGANKIHNRGKVLGKWAARHTIKTGHKWQGQ